MRFCLHPGCSTKVQRGRCAVHQRQANQAREVASPWRALYRTDGWRARRAAQLVRVPLCEDCNTHPATDAHHVEAHRGDARLFWTSRLMSLCARCHARRTGKGE